MDNPEPLETPAAALRAAAHEGDERTVLHLINEGVDLNVPDLSAQFDRRGNTALSLAAGGGHMEIVKMLIEAGAWVDPHEDYDLAETPLMAAARGGHLAIVQELIAHGADHRLHVGYAQARAEFYARNHGHAELAKYLDSLDQ